MKHTLNTVPANKKTYCTPAIERIALDTEIALSMVSVPGNPGSPGFIPEAPENFVMKLFKIRW
jgi:hypothetical protein